MTREQKIAKAKKLKAKGLSNREVAERLGVTTSAVTKWLNPNTKLWNQRQNASPERKAAKRQWADENDRPLCAECGFERGAGQQRKNPDGLCRACRNDRLRSQHLARCHRIEYLWNLGRTLGEIAEDLGSTPGSISVSMVHMRAEGGWDLPYRYAVQDGRRIAA